MNDMNEDFYVVGMEENAGSVGKKELPAKVSVWTKFKDFLFQDVETMQLDMSQGEKKFVDFWAQEVTIDKAYNFLFQEIKIK